MKTVNLLGRKLGSGQPCFILAEAGVNHNGDIGLARKLVDAAVEARADAVKFQTFRADQIASNSAPKAKYQLESTDAEESQLEMLKRLELPDEAYRDLMDYCRQKGIAFLSTPFDESSADMLNEMGMGAFKLPSGEITNLPFVRHVAVKGKPIILSTGMAGIGEVETAVNAIEDAGNPDLILLHCVSNYPAAPGDVNLRAMHTLATAFNVPVGYSDHTQGIEIALAAVTLGACLIEKHFTLDRNLPGPDHQASLEPDELAKMIQGIRAIESALGDGRKQPTASEASTASVARRSLVAARDITAGTVLGDNMVTAMRPGTGLPPAMQKHVIGRTLRRNVSKGELLQLEMLE
jgi:N-acetylneuraminate synthase